MAETLCEIGMGPEPAKQVLFKRTCQATATHRVHGTQRGHTIDFVACAAHVQLWVDDPAPGLTVEVRDWWLVSCERLSRLVDDG